MKICKENRIAVDTTRDAAAFTIDNLKKYKVVVFLNTTGDVLDNGQQEAFIKYIQSGGGFVGVHAAPTRNMTGPGIISWWVPISFRILHSSRKPLLMWLTNQTLQQPCYLKNGNGRMSGIISSKSVQIFTCWHISMKNHTQAGKTVKHILSYGAMNSMAGRAFYTGVGHREDNYSEPLVQQHLLGAIKWAGKIK